MKKNILLPDYLFEISWEVCNKVGGIYTVLSTKAETIAETEGINAVYIGPDLWKEKKNPLFTEDKRLWKEWRKNIADEKFTVRCGYWEIPGRPKVMLVDYTAYFDEKENFYARLWNEYHVDSLHAYGDYDDSVMFGYAVGQVIESFHKFYLKESDRVVVQAHEWQSGSAALYIKKNLPQAGTIFTTHATSIGRSICSNGKPLYDYFEGYNGDQMAAELNVESKHSIEKQSALNVDCFTTVSEITAKECKQLIERDIDVILENGFEKDFVPTGKEFDKRRKEARDMRLRVARALTGDNISDDALIIGTGGRMEMRNKGIDLFLEVMARLQNSEELERDVIAFIDVPAWSGDAREDLCKRLNSDASQWNTPLPDPYLTHNLCNFSDDAIASSIRNLGIANHSGKNKVKVIYVPCYLKGSDGIFNKDYYDILIGNDLNIYPSYYEPWGYTPLESVAFHIPTITTDLAGFGLWVNSVLGRYGEISDGVEVVNRNDSNYFDSAAVITKSICIFAKILEKEVADYRKKAAKFADKALWKHFIKNYLRAYSFALEAAEERKKK
ncbi:MAG: glycogen/starch synthase [Bacteroidaceae bacterium]|nr:glycogen/starch synthase [Bacteroidaceae bacterium]MBQ8270757.1 glycogen/starch synthase [Bacteroidaceae bacterium]